MGAFKDLVMGEQAMDSIDEVVELANNLQTPLFATKDSLEEAYAFTFDMINSMPPELRAGMITAVQVLINTIAEEIKRRAEG